METPIILTDPREVRTPDDGTCPGCGAPEADRVPSAGFGRPHPVCKRCGHRFTGAKD
jgi:rubredoxin